jgi:hypothetical protein
MECDLRNLITPERIAAQISVDDMLHHRKQSPLPDHATIESMRNPHPTGDINDRLPIVPHQDRGVDCYGCLYVRVTGELAEIVCNECAAVIRSVPLADVERVVLELDETVAVCSAVCSHCGALNTFPGLSTIEAFVCSECGEGVHVSTPVQ